MALCLLSIMQEKSGLLDTCISRTSGQPVVDETTPRFALSNYGSNSLVMIEDASQEPTRGLPSCIFPNIWNWGQWQQHGRTALGQLVPMVGE